MAQNDPIYAALDAALDDLDDDNDRNQQEIRNEETSPAATADHLRPATSNVSKEQLPTSTNAAEDLIQNIMKQMMTEGTDEPNSAVMQDIMREMERNITMLQQATVASSQSNLTESAASTSTEKSQTIDNSVENAIENLVQGISQSQHENVSPKDLEQDLLQQLLQGMDLGGLHSNDDNVDGLGNHDAILDGMMQQLVSKELMYEPMKQVADRFPQWLRQHEVSLSPEEKTRYVLYNENNWIYWNTHRSALNCATYHLPCVINSRQQQCECFQQLVRAYEQEPDNTSKLMELMQRAQEFGQPPPEIIAEIAPDLQLDPDGLPNIENMGDEDCCIM